MILQDYLIHMVNGDVIPVSEPYDLNGARTLIARYGKAKPDTMFCTGDRITGFAYFPARSIAYISTGDIREVEDWAFNLQKHLRKYENRKNSGYEKEDAYEQD